MQKLIALFFCLAATAFGQVSSVTIDANGNILNGKIINFATGKLSINGVLVITPSDVAFASTWNGVTTIAPSKNAVYDYVHLFDTDDDGKVNMLDQVAGIPLTDANGALLSPITDNSSNWNTAYTDRLKWDGGATGLVAATGRTSLGLATSDSPTFSSVKATLETYQSSSTSNSLLTGKQLRFRQESGDELNSGVIDYGLINATQLSIGGLGSSTGNRIVYIYDKLGIDGLTASSFIETDANKMLVSKTATEMRTDLGLVIGTNVQAYDVDLDTWATKTPYAGTLTITTGKTFNVTNTLTLSGTDTSTLNIGTGGTLGTAAYTSSGDYQPLDADLTSLAAATSSDKIYYRSAPGTWDIANMGTTGLSFTSGTFIIDPEIAAFASLTSAADKLPYYTGSGTATLANFTAAGRALVDDADSTAQRATLGLVIGTNVQAYDADLTTWAGITPGTGAGTALAINVGTAGAFVINGGELGTPSGGTLTNATGLPESGVTNLVSDLALKAPLASPTFTGTVTIPTPFTLGAVSVTPTGTELNYVAGVTSAIQTQLNGKQASGSYATSAQGTTADNAMPKAGGTFVGDVLFTDALYDIGKSGATRPRDLFLSRNATFGGTVSLGATTGVRLYIYDGGENNPRAGLGVDAFGGSRELSIFHSTSGTDGVITLGKRLESNGAFTTAVTIDPARMSLSVPAKLKGYTVAGLPAGTQGDTAFVTDALTPTYGAAAVGGGAVVLPVFYNGTAWITQ